MKGEYPEVTIEDWPILAGIPKSSQGSNEVIKGLFFFVFFFFNIFIYLTAPGLSAACGVYLPDQGSNLGPPALGAQSRSHWTTREVPD